jgi:hypothetical protein
MVMTLVSDKKVPCRSRLLYILLYYILYLSDMFSSCKHAGMTGYTRKNPRDTTVKNVCVNTRKMG